MFIEDNLFHEIFSSNIDNIKINNNRIITPEVKVGTISIGGNNPIIIQSMTSGIRRFPDNPIEVAKDEAKEAILLANAGAEIVRIAINSNAAIQAIPHIKDILVKNNLEKLPLVGCGQFELHSLIKKYPQEIKLLDKIRINPGTIGKTIKRDLNFENVITFAIKNNMPIRIGVNWGSIDNDLLDKIKLYHCKDNIITKDILLKTLIYCAIKNVKAAEKIGMPRNKIIISCKLSIVEDLIKVCNFISKYNITQHIGLTEAGIGRNAIVKTSIALSHIIKNGIGDTIRASLTPSSSYDRTEEVKLCQDILQSTAQRNFRPEIISCPGCGRTNSKSFQILAESIEKYVQYKMPMWKNSFQNIAKLKIAVMGCIVNGPGESKHADIGISFPGYKEKPIVAVYKKSKYYKTIKADKIEEIEKQFIQIIEEFIQTEYQAKK